MQDTLAAMALVSELGTFKKSIFLQIRGGITPAFLVMVFIKYVSLAAAVTAKVDIHQAVTCNQLMYF